MPEKILFSRMNEDLQFTHNPSDVRDYELNYAVLLQSDTISATEVSGENITVDSNSTANNKVTIVLSGGNAGSTGKVKTKITSTNGLVFERTFKVRIREL